MTLTELINEVYILTNRPDLTGQTLSTVRSATLALHHSDYYFKDLYETGIVFDTSATVQQLEYRNLFPTWRSLKYLRKLDVSTGTQVPGLFFSVIDPTDILDQYQVTKDNIVYVAGDNLNARSSVAFQHCLIGFYRNPLLGTTNDTFSSWIAIDHPWAVIYTAASTVLKMIGKDSAAKSMEGLAAMQLVELRNLNVIANGY